MVVIGFGEMLTLTGTMMWKLMYIPVHLRIFGDIKPKLQTHGNVFSGIRKQFMELNLGMQLPALGKEDSFVNFKLIS